MSRHFWNFLIKWPSIIVNIIKSVHRVLFFVTPSLPKEYFENVDSYRLRMKMQCNNQHFKRHTVAIDPLPPAYSVYSFENDDNSGRPLSIHISSFYMTISLILLSGQSTITCQFGAFLFGARQFDACQFGAFHFDAVPVRRVSVWRDASLARFTLARFPFFCLNCTEVFSTSVWHVSRFAHIC